MIATEGKTLGRHRRRPLPAVRAAADPGGDLVLLGVIGGAHGVRGEVRVKSFTADPAAIGAYGTLWDATGARAFRLVVRRMARGMVIARIAGVADRAAAERLKGTPLHARRDSFPALAAEEYYQADLIGLGAETTDGRMLGTVVAVRNFGAGDLLEIAEGRRAVLVPFRRAVVTEIDLAGRRVVVAPPPGLLDDRPAAGDGREGDKR